MKMDVIPFGRNDIDNLLLDDPALADRLPFGAILLDRAGRVKSYNAAEGFHARWAPEEVIGRDFFRDIAACAVGTRLHGEFLSFVDRKEANVIFDYSFDYDGQPARMRIHLRSWRGGEACWMFVKRA